jgi:peptide methionine sulfoxide reductase msrA/msrB
MKNILSYIILILIVSITYSQEIKNAMNYNKLTDFEKKIILNKGTESPFTGKYDKHYEEGVYKCKQCNSVLFESTQKFNSGCGWPAFDNSVKGAIKEVLDADGKRKEIVCANCGGHLGHVFRGERFTSTNTRHCVNSASLIFESNNDTEKGIDNNLEIAIFAGGCFWGIEYHMQNTKGVIETEVGYIGGISKDPTYQEVCSGTTGHAEAVKITFDNSKVNFETLAKLFFEIHDPGTINRQGPDIGNQYRSEIFFTNEHQKQISQELIKLLESKGHKVVTKLSKAGDFYKAEKYHQDYYNKSGSLPYCHFYKKKF